MAGMIVHAREPLNHRRHPWQGPEIGGKAMRPRPLAERAIQSLQVGLVQLRFASRPPGAAQRGGAAALPLVVPSTDALPAHPQGASNGGHDLARPKQARRTAAAQFQGVEVSPWHHMGWHAPSINWGPRIVTLFCETH